MKKATGGRRGGASPQAEIESLRPQLEAYEALCDELGEQPSDVAIAWLLAQPVATATITGPRTVQQLTGNLQAMDVRLSAEILAKLDAIWAGPGGEAPEAYAW